MNRLPKEEEIVESDSNVKVVTSNDDNEEPDLIKEGLVMKETKKPVLVTCSHHPTQSKEINLRDITRLIN